jgi:hypothetical protein
MTRDNSEGLIASVLAATDRLSWISACNRSSPMRLRQRVSDERSNTSRCWKNSSPQKFGNDGHTLATVIPDMEALVGNTIARILADKGYRGHNAPPDYRFRVFISGQKRGVTPSIKRQLRRRSAVEPVIGHLKAEHRMGRNYLWFRRGDAANAVLAAAGYNFRRLIRWLSILVRQILTALFLEPFINPI